MQVAQVRVELLWMLLVMEVAGEAGRAERLEDPGLGGKHWQPRRDLDLPSRVTQRY